MRNKKVNFEMKRSSTTFGAVSVKKFCLGALGSSSPIVPGHFYLQRWQNAGYTLDESSLVQVNSVLDESKPRGTSVFFRGLFLSFPLCFFIVVAFPFLSFKIFFTKP